MSDLISRQAAIERVLAGKLSDDSLVECVEECNSMLEWAADVLKNMPSAEPDKRIAKIEDLVEGTIDHLDLEDAMDLLYQIKGVLK